MMKSLTDSGKQFIFNSMCATLKNVLEMIKSNPKWVHISGHAESDGFESSLIFEKETTREAVKISEDTLRETLRDATNFKPELVFVATCHGFPFAEIFLEAGAEHVIVVDKDQDLLDDVAIEFTKSLYSKLTSPGKICDFFQQSKSDCKTLYKS